MTFLRGLGAGVTGIALVSVAACGHDAAKSSPKVKTAPVVGFTKMNESICEQVDVTGVLGDGARATLDRRKHSDTRGACVASAGTSSEVLSFGSSTDPGLLALFPPGVTLAAVAKQQSLDSSGLTDLSGGGYFGYSYVKNGSGSDHLTLRKGSSILVCALTFTGADSKSAELRKVCDAAQALLVPAKIAP